MRNEKGQWLSGHSGNPSGRPPGPEPFNLLDELRPELRAAAASIIRRRLAASQIAPGAGGLEPDLFILRLAFTEDLPGQRDSLSASQLLRFLQSEQGWTFALDAVIQGLLCGAYTTSQQQELRRALGYEHERAAETSRR